jgi:hypothetical protein
VRCSHNCDSDTDRTRREQTTAPTPGHRFRPDHHIKISGVRAHPARRRSRPSRRGQVPLAAAAVGCFAGANGYYRRVLVIPESRAEQLLSPKAATRWRKRSGASKVPRALALLTQRGRPCSRRCLHSQSSAIVRRRPGLQDGYQNGWDQTLLSHLAGSFGEFGVNGRNLPPARSQLRTRFNPLSRWRHVARVSVPRKTHIRRSVAFLATQHRRIKKHQCERHHTCWRLARLYYG